MQKKTVTTPRQRDRLPLTTITKVLTESGYRCAVPTCRGILALDMHHVWEVSAGGGDGPENLIALCPTCHALYHRGTIKQESIYAWKSMLVAIGRAFDVAAIDQLTFLTKFQADTFIVSGDGALHFARLIAADLVSMKMLANFNNAMVTYAINISSKGRQLIDAWCAGDRAAIAIALHKPPSHQLIEDAGD